jgi:PelA/Pel-15E family pectate lyase
LLRDLSSRDFAFVDERRRKRAAEAIDRTVQMMLATQIRVAGHLTAWCAQHDAVTFEPRSARSYELVSLSGKESAEILEFLVSVPRPTPAIADAIEQGVAWLRSVQITGRRVDRVPAPGLTPTFDLKVVADATAAPLWARFYEIATNRPMFVGRDGVVKYDLSAIEHERRTGYSWLGPYAKRLLEKDYPAWKRARR